MTAWRVAGNRTVLGVEPGDVIDEEIPPEQVASLLFGGHIEEVDLESESSEEATVVAAENPQEGD